MKLNQSEVVEYIKTHLKEFGGEMNQTQIAKEIGRTPARVSQILKSIRLGNALDEVAKIGQEISGVPQGVSQEVGASTAEAAA